MDTPKDPEEQEHALDARTERQHRARAVRVVPRLVKRDERFPQGKTPPRDESLLGNLVYEFESEIFRLESRGGRLEIIAHPTSLESASPALALVDWCAFTVRPPEGKTYRWVLDELGQMLGFREITPRKSGLYGYSESAVIEDGGLAAWGGKKQRGTVYISLNGQGCSRIRDWAIVVEWFKATNATITRVDLAHDDFEGRELSIETAYAWWMAGGFNSGGRRPQATPAGDWWGLAKGRTVYIGDRTSGKLLRVYEKGKQLGDFKSFWTRAELELHNKHRVIPLDVVVKPGGYLASAYPCLRFLSAEQCRIKTLRKAATTSYARAVENTRQHSGRTINLMLHVKGGDYASVVEDLRREGVPGSLKEYGYHLKTNAELVHELDRGGTDADTPFSI